MRSRLCQLMTRHLCCLRLLLLLLVATHSCTQVLSPFIDPVTKSKAEFVSTSDYEPSKTGKDSSSSSWFGGSSSWFSSSKPASQQQQQPASPSLSRDSQDADVDIVVEDQAVKGPGTFGPLLCFYKTPYCFNRNQQLLAAAGLA